MREVLLCHWLVMAFERIDRRKRNGSPPCCTASTSACHQNKGGSNMSALGMASNVHRQTYRKYDMMAEQISRHTPIKMNMIQIFTGFYVLIMLGHFHLYNSITLSRIFTCSPIYAVNAIKSFSSTCLLDVCMKPSWVSFNSTSQHSLSLIALDCCIGGVS